MEELCSMWEVPTIAHFCYVFRAAFNLFHFEIEELEAALLQDNSDQQPCATIEQLAMRLLQGCMKKQNVTDENWEVLLHAHFRQDDYAAKQYEAWLKSETPFSSLFLREKVKILFSLCQLRLHADDVLDSIKAIDVDDLRVTPLGTDSKNCNYWHFFGMRLYKEDVKLATKFSKESKKATANNRFKVVNGHTSTSSRSRKSSRMVAKVNIDDKDPPSGWSVVCHTLEDWKSLTQSLRRSNIVADKKLSKLLQNDYIIELEEEEQKKERQKRKRMLELAPRRISSRIDENKKQKQKIQLQRQALEEEERRKKELKKAAMEAEEKKKIAEGRAQRARLREMKWQGGENSNSADGYSQHHFRQSERLIQFKAQAQDDEISNSASEEYSGASPNNQHNFSGASPEDLDDDESSSQSDNVSNNYLHNSHYMENDEEDSSDESSSGSESENDEDFLSFEPSASKVPKTECYSLGRTVDGATIVSQVNSMNKTPINGNFAALSGVSMNGKGFAANILYNSYRTYSEKPSTPFLPTVPEVKQ